MNSLVPLFLALLLYSPVALSHNYADALSKSILFFEGQRSGHLPADQRLKWRQSSGLKDGYSSKYQVDLTGGYYDAGDNVKFGFPMAFSMTMLAWSIVDFGNGMSPSEKKNALLALKWGTDYLLKTVSQPDRIFVQVGDPLADHNCWERPEDMDTVRTVYAVEAPKPASEIASETAAALAGASMAFRPFNRNYAGTLLQNAIRVFKYADTHRGAYSDNAEIKAGVCPFYCDFSGYKDELLWGAAWLRRATGEQSYLTYLANNRKTLAAGETIAQFGWDNKFAGLNVLISKEVLEGKQRSVEEYKVSAEKFMCMLVKRGTAGSAIEYSPGGLIYYPGMCNLQHATSISLLILSYADSLSKSSSSLVCDSVPVSPDTLRRLAKKQVDYILGDNPMKMSYMVGYGDKYPQRIHHRGSSLPSVKDHPKVIACKDGTSWFNSTKPNPNLLIGAVVGGPGKDDVFTDDRQNAGISEPTTYINAPLVGALAYFAANPNFT